MNWRLRPSLRRLAVVVTALSCVAVLPTSAAAGAATGGGVDLAAVVDRIDAEASRLLAEGIELASWGPVGDRVEIRVVDPRPADVERLEARYGERVRVVAGARARFAAGECESRVSCPTLRGGLQVVGSELLGACTSAFQAVDAVSGAPLMLTAGHCVGSTGTFLHDLLPVGPVVVNGFEPVPSAAPNDEARAGAVPVWHTDVDAVSVAQIDAGGQQVSLPGFVFPWRSSNWIYVSDAEKERPVVGTADAVSGSACVSGRNAGTACASVTGVGFSVLVEATAGDVPAWAGGSAPAGYVLLTDMTTARFSGPCVYPGDSGAPVFRGSPATALGILATATPCSRNQEISFTPIRRVETRLGVTVRTSPPG